MQEQRNNPLEEEKDTCCKIKEKLREKYQHLRQKDIFNLNRIFLDFEQDHESTFPLTTKIINSYGNIKTIFLSATAAELTYTETHVEKRSSQ